jgi:hypothetical protein
MGHVMAGARRWLRAWEDRVHYTKFEGEDGKTGTVSSPTFANGGRMWATRPEHSVKDVMELNKQRQLCAMRHPQLLEANLLHFAADADD